MSKNKFGSFKVGDEVIFNNDKVVIISKQKGGKSTKRNMHSGVLFTGYASRPCTYTLSNGYTVRGNKITLITN